MRERVEEQNVSGMGVGEPGYKRGREFPPPPPEHSKGRWDALRPLCQEQSHTHTLTTLASPLSKAMERASLR